MRWTIPYRRFLATLVAVVLALGFVGSGGPAASPALTDPQNSRPTRFDEWRVASFLEDAGLEERTVSDIDFEPNGTVWCAASDGLYRYDGYLWKRFSADHGLPGESVRCVLVTQDGELWVGTNLGAGRFEGGRFVPVAAESGLGERTVRRIVEDPDGTLWFCCDRWSDRPGRGGLIRLRDGEFRLFDESDGLPSEFVTDFFRDSRGRGFVLTDGDLVQLDGERFVRPIPGLDPNVRSIWSIDERPDGALVALTFRGSYTWEEGTGWQWGAGGVVGGLAHPVLLRTRDGQLITGTQGSRAQFSLVSDGDLEPASYAFAGATSGVRVLAEAPDGSVWAGGGNLLVRWQRSGGEWRAFPAAKSPQFRDESGRIWFSAPSMFGPGGGDVVALHKGQWTERPEIRQFFTRAGMVAYDTATDIIAEPADGEAVRVAKSELGMTTVGFFVHDGRGDLWTAEAPWGDKSAVAHFDGEQWRRVALPVGDSPYRAVNLCPDMRDGAWLVISDFATDLSRVFHLRRSGVVEVPMPRPMTRFTPPLEILADRDGLLWVFGYIGLYCREDGEWRRIEEMPGRHIMAGVQRENDHWFAVSGATGGSAGLVSYRDGEWEHFPVVLREFVGSDSNGALFFSTSEGLCVVPPGRASPSLLTVPTEYSVTSAVLSEQGDLWVGTEDVVGDRRVTMGALCYRTDGIPPETIAAPGAVHFSFGDEVHIDVRGIERFKPRSMASNMRVSTRRPGGEWTAFEALRDERIALSDFPVGEHTLLVRVQDEGLDVDPSPATVRFSVLPIPVQARWWFWPVIGAVFVVIVTLTGLMGRAKRRLSQLAETLSETVAQRTAELQMSERKYRNLFEQSHDAVCLTDLDGAITDANGTALELLGFERRDMIGARPAELFIDDADLQQIQRDLQQGLAVRDRPCTVHTREGLALEVRVTANRRWDEDGNATGKQLILRDVTTETRLEERLRQTQKMEAVGRLAGGVAHDFNNLLTAIVGYGELLALKTAKDPGVRRDVEMVLEAAERAQALTGQIQTFSRGQIIEPRIIDLNEVVEGMEKLLERIIGEDVHLASHLDAGIANVRLDPGQLEQVVVNLAVNARDAMPDGGRLTLETAMVVLDPEAARHAELEHGRYVRLQVIDTGTGIDPSTRQKIFEPFFTTKDQGQGTGLGLATVYGIVRQGGGGIDVHSLPGSGTTFRIYLPACEEEVLAADETFIPVQVKGGDETILVVEDERAIRGLIERLLIDVGYHVITAPDAESALARAKLHTGPIQLLLTDLILPGRKGWELAAELTDARDELRTLFMSGYAEADHAGRSRWETTEPVLKKPFVPSMLRHRVREILDQPPTRPARANGRKRRTSG